MDKRTLLAFALSFLILFIWLYFFEAKKKQVPHQKKTEAVQPSGKPVDSSRDVVATVEKKEETSDLPKVFSKPENSVMEKAIEVDTPLFHAVFSNVGPTIKSIKLKKYLQAKEPNSPLIELVSLEKGMGDFLNIKFEPAKSVNKDNQLIYDVNKNSLNLSSNAESESLTFTARTPDGLEISQVYRFSPSKYGMLLEVHVKNLAGQRIEGGFSAGLRVLPPKGKSEYYSYIGLVALIDDKLEEVEIEKELEGLVLV